MMYNNTDDNTDDNVRRDEIHSVNVRMDVAHHNSLCKISSDFGFEASYFS